MFFRSPFPQFLSSSIPQFPCQMLLQVHDELVFEVAQTAVEKAKLLIKREMEQAAQLSVPLTVDIGVGSHWGAAH